MKKLALFVSLVALLGCNALNKAGSDSTKPAFDLSGSWEVVATSTQKPGVVSYVEFNATQQGNGNITAPVQEFILGTSVATLANCLGVPPGTPQGNISGTVDGSSITGSFTETSPHGSASFSIQAPVAGATSFSGNFIGATANSIECADAGTFVATKTTPLSGTYTGHLTYPDGSVETMSLTATQDSAYNLTISGTASGGNNDGPINLTGKVMGNLAEVNNSTNTRPLFAWWDSGVHKLWIVATMATSTAR